MELFPAGAQIAASELGALVFASIACLIEQGASAYSGRPHCIFCESLRFKHYSRRLRDQMQQFATAIYCNVGRETQ